jgi:two-component system response regulator (stage 0 sporulation protein A)
MNKIKVLVIDEDVEFTNMIKQYFVNHAVIEVISKAYEEMLETDLVNIEIKVSKKDTNNYSIDKRLVKTLHELGMPSHIKGYNYITYAIKLVYGKKENTKIKIKNLYEETAQKFNTTVSRVERNIRHAIEISWNRGSWDFINETFGHSVDINRAKPTNSEFIITVANKIQLKC